VSGLVPGPFVVLGFLPRDRQERAVGLVDTLGFLRETLGDRHVTVARELTKIHEEVRHGTLTAVADHYRTEPPRGEIVIVVGGSEAVAGESAEDDESVLRSLLATGLSVSRAAKEAAALTGRPRSELYGVAQRLRSGATVAEGLGNDNG
jgi:16S rRNA (cytidine1402-2'-O)-methyltransferase